MLTELLIFLPETSFPRRSECPPPLLYSCLCTPFILQRCLDCKHIATMHLLFPTARTGPKENIHLFPVCLYYCDACFSRVHYPHLPPKTTPGKRTPRDNLWAWPRMTTYTKESSASQASVCMGIVHMAWKADSWALGPELLIRLVWADVWTCTSSQEVWILWPQDHILRIIELNIVSLQHICQQPKLTMTMNLNWWKRTGI